MHESRLAAAEAYVRAYVAGPAREATLARLGRECLGVWQAGRQLCDALSVTGRPCAFRVHLLPHENAEPPEGLAAASGLLRVGDKLLAINGATIVGHARATIALKSAVGELRLSVLRTASLGLGGAKTEDVEVRAHTPRLLLIASDAVRLPPRCN